MGRNTKGEGSTPIKTAGGWRAYITVNGKRKYTATMPTKAAAGQAKRELLNAKDAGTLVIGKSATVAEWMRHWLTIAKLKPTVRAAYAHNIEHYIVPSLGAIKLPDLLPEHLEKLYADMASGALSQQHTVIVGKKVTVVQYPLAPRTIGNVHANLRRALTVAVQRGRVNRNVALLVTPPAKPKADTTAFSEADTRQILAASMTDRFAARWHLGLLHGVRPAEALGLSWADVDFTTGMVHVHAQLQRVRGEGLHYEPTAKTAAGDREIPVAPIVLDLLRKTRQQQMVDRIEYGDEYTEWQYNGQPVALVFTQANGRPVDTRRDSANWARLLEDAGIPHARRYQGRHTAATLMVSMGADATTVAAILGHAKASMTYDLYIHPLEEKVKQIGGLMGGLSVRVDSAPYLHPMTSMSADVERNG